MADYYATTRSNYFRVKDAATFTAWCDEWNLSYWMSDINTCETNLAA